MLDRKPTSSQILKPTGTILEVSGPKEDLEFFIGNLLTIYGIPNAMRISYIISDFVKNSNFYSYLDLVKLTTNFGLACSVTALSIGLGANETAELAKLELLYPAVNRAFGDMPSLVVEPLNSFGLVIGLAEVLNWFDYEDLDVSFALEDFGYFNQWLSDQEPRYKDLFMAEFDPAKYLNSLLTLKAGFVITPELVAYLKKLYY